MEGGCSPQDKTEGKKEKKQIDRLEADLKQERRRNQQLEHQLAESQTSLDSISMEHALLKSEFDSVQQKQKQNTNSPSQTDISDENRSEGPPEHGTETQSSSFFSLRPFSTGKKSDRLEADLKQERRRNQQLEHQLAESQKSLDSISMEHGSLKSEFDSVKYEQERLQQRNSRLQADINAEKSSKEQLQKELDKQSDRCKHLSAESATLRSERVSVEQEKASLEDTLKREMAGWESEKKSFTIKIENLEKEIKAIKRNKVDAKDDLEKANQTALTQASIIQQLEAKLAKYSQELARIKHENERHEEQERIHRETIQDLETKMRDFKSRNNTLEAQIRIVTDKGEEEKEGLFKNAEDATKHVTELETRIAKLRDQLHQKDQQIESLNQTVRRLTDDFKRLTAERGLQTNEQEGLRKQIEDLKMQCEEMTRSLSHKDEQHRMLIRQASDLTTTQVAEVKEKLKINEDANASLKRDIEKLQTEKRNKEEERKLMVDTVDKLKQQYADLSVTSTFKDDELAQLRTEITALKSSTEAREKALLESHQREIERMRQEYNTSLRSMEKRQAEEREELQTQVETLFRSLHDDKRVEQDTISAAVQQMAATNAKTNQIMNAAFRAYQAARERQAKF